MSAELATLAVTDGTLVSALAGDGKATLERQTLPDLLPRQRWFGAKDHAIEAVHLVPLGDIVRGEHALLAADVALSGETQRYLLPVSAIWGAKSEGGTAGPVLARIERDGRSGLLIDGALDPGMAATLMDAMREGRRLETAMGSVEFSASASLRRLAEPGAPRPLGAEQSNVSIAFGNTAILKIYRRLRAGEQPDVEVARFLSGPGQFASTPEFLGEIRYVPAEGEATTLAAAFAFVPNQGDAWAFVTDALTHDLVSRGAEGAGQPSEFAPSLLVGSLLGQRTAELHKSLAVETDDFDFVVEALTKEDVENWSREAAAETAALLDRLQAGLARLSPSARPIAEQVLSKREAVLDRLRACTRLEPSGGRSRIHGDYHLGQVLVTGGDVMIIDFEGEPKRSLAERRAKSSPLRDVAGMLRSFHYAAWTGLDRYRQAKGTVPEHIAVRAERWRQQVTGDFLEAYGRHIAGAASYPTDQAFAGALSDLFLLQKAVYEVGYELANRPDWVEIPLSGIRDLLSTP